MSNQSKVLLLQLSIVNNSYCTIEESEIDTASAQKLPYISMTEEVAEIVFRVRFLIYDSLQTKFGPLWKDCCKLIRHPAVRDSTPSDSGEWLFRGAIAVFTLERQLQPISSSLY